MAVIGTPEDYDEWGPEWSFERFAPYLARAREMLRVGPANTETPAPFHVAFLEAAAELGLPFLDDPDDPSQPVGSARLPSNVVDGSRWNTSFAYLDAARERPNLVVLGDTLVDRVMLDGDRATGVVTVAGEADRGRHRRADGGRLLHARDPAPERDRAGGGAPSLRRPRSRGAPGRRGAARSPRHGDPVGDDAAPRGADRRSRPTHRAPVPAARPRQGCEQSVRARELGPPPHPVDERGRRARHVRGERRRLPRQATLDRPSAPRLARPRRAPGGRAGVPARADRPRHDRRGARARALTRGPAVPDPARRPGGGAGHGAARRLRSPDAPELLPSSRDVQDRTRRGHQTDASSASTASSWRTPRSCRRSRARTRT